MDRITWDEYFMSIALLSAKRSADPSTQVGACIVDSNNKVVSIGYNGMPRGIDDCNLSWNRNGTDLDSKYLYVCHAEFNAILNIPKTLKDFGIDEEEFKSKISTIAELAVGDACTGSNPRAITPAEMEKLLTCTYYGTEVDF